ncbi:MAG: ABC transporter permease [Nitrospirae bacterium]|jgi:cell division transport system permease protein|nr:ABC transporter permease [Nitrospirota bacterium]
MSLPYSFKLAVSSMLHEKWINMLSVLTIAAGLLFTAIIAVTIYNVDMLTKKLPDRFSVMVFLKENLPQEELNNIIAIVKKDNSVENVRYIPKDDALKELKATLKNTEYVLEGLGENPLPDSIEIKLKSDAVSPDTVKQLTTVMKDLKGIDEIEYGEKFLSSIYSLRLGVKTAGFVFAAIMISGMIFVCYSTIKLLFYRKVQEIETYKLLGATKGFIRAPFIIEGAAMGLAGGILSLVGILLLYYSVILKLSLTIPLLKALFFPINLSFILPLTGLFLGILGAHIAIGRIRY